MELAKVSFNLFPSRPQLPILMFHGIGDPGGGLDVNVYYFRHMVQNLKWRGYHFCTPDEVKRFVNGDYDAIPEKSIWINFDDGYQSCHDYATEILRKYGARASIAPETANLDTANFLNTADIPDMLDVWDFVLHAHAGAVRIQAESDGTEGPFYGNRKYLTGPGRHETDEEFKARVSTDIETSQDFIETYTGKRPTVLIWPYGHYGVATSDPVSGYANDPDNVPGLLEEILGELGITCAFTYNAWGDSERFVHDVILDNPYHGPRIFMPDNSYFESPMRPLYLGVKVKLLAGDTQDINFRQICTYNNGYLAADPNGYLLEMDTNFVPITTSFQPSDGPGGVRIYPIQLDNGDVWISSGNTVYKIDMDGQSVLDSFALGQYAYNLVTDGQYGYIVIEGGGVYRIDFTTEAVTNVGSFPTPPHSPWSYYGTAFYPGYLYAQDWQAGIIYKMRLSDFTVVKQAQLPLRIVVATSYNRLAGVALAEDDLVLWLEGYRGEAVWRLIRVIL